MTDAVLITEGKPVKGQGHRIIWCNKAFSDHSGYLLSDIVGQTPSLLQGVGSSREARKRMRDALFSGLHVREEILNYTKSGTPFWNEVDIVPVIGASGAPDFFVSVQRDITDRKRRELEIRALRLCADFASDRAPFVETAATVLSATQVGVWQLELGNSLVRCDRRAAEILTGTDSVHIHIDDLLHNLQSDDKEAIRNLFLSAMEERAPFCTVVGYQRPDGNKRVLRLWVDFLLIDGRQTMMGVLADVTSGSQLIRSSGSTAERTTGGAGQGETSAPNRLGRSLAGFLGLSR